DVLHHPGLPARAAAPVRHPGRDAGQPGPAGHLLRAGGRAALRLGTVYSFISIPLIIAAGVVLLAVFFLVQKARQEHEPLIPFALFRNRNFTLMNWVSCTLSIGMLGIFLPLTIYLQSALGFSALKAGLTLAPSSLVMIFAAPFLGKLTD